MRIKKILISFEVQEKIFKKHNIKREEIEEVFLENDPLFYRTKKDRYTAIGFIGKYITVIFDYKDKNAEIVTAYISSKWQKRLYKVKQ